MATDIFHLKLPMIKLPNQIFTDRTQHKSDSGSVLGVNRHIIVR